MDVDDHGEEIFDESDLDPDSELAQLLGQTPAQAPAADKKPKFQCAGSKRTDRETGKKRCDYKAVRAWEGPCPKCGEYFGCIGIKRTGNATSRVTLGAETMSKAKDLVYYSTGIPEFDKVLGGGLVYEKTLLIGAPRGAGKTTILLQACDGFAQDGRKAYFASGEMTREAVIAYAKRMGITNENIGLFGNPEGVDVEDLFEDVLAFGARLLVIDSLQVATVSDVKGDIGTPVMVDAVANMVTSFAQKKKRVVVVIGHLQKSGDFGGTEKLQHLVDGLVRLDIKYAGTTPDGKPIDVMIREISMDGKSRQGRSDITSLVELTEQGMRPPSVKALRAFTHLHLPG